MSTTWMFRWPVSSRTTDKVYTVAMKVDGTWGCDCPKWKFAKAPKPDCHHILKVKAVEPVDASYTPTIDKKISRQLPGEPKRRITFDEVADLQIESVCLCGAPMKRGVCSVIGCVASARKAKPQPTKTIQPQPYFVTQTRRAITLED